MILDPETQYFVEALMAQNGVASNIDVEELSFDEVIVLCGNVPANEELTYEDRNSLNCVEGSWTAL